MVADTTMTRNDFIRLMQYPREWQVWNMLPDDLIDAQMAEYRPGDERDAARYRNAAFHYWLQTEPGKDMLLKLIRLSYLDPDPLGSYAFRKDYIASLPMDDEDVAYALRQNRI